MSLNSNTQNVNQSHLLQQRLQVREQEISGLKIQNRHLLGKIEELEKQAKPNQIDTQFVADEVRKHLDPVIQQVTSTITASFEMLQSTMRGIYQQSQRSQKAVEDMFAYTRDLELRLNDQRKQDQNFYQDKVFSMIGNFCDRLERQIEIRLKSLSAVELMNLKQNEVLGELEALKVAVKSIQNVYAGEINERIVNLLGHTNNSVEINRDALQQIQNQRGEFKLIRSELKQTLENMNRVLGKIENQEPITATEKEIQAAAPEAVEPSQGAATQDETQKDAAMILSLLRAEKDELNTATERAKHYLQESGLDLNPSLNRADQGPDSSEGSDC